MPRNLPETVTVEIQGHRIVLDVEEAIFADRSCGQYTNGLACFDKTGAEYFVDECGIVWRQPGNIECGIAPEIKDAADRMEAQLEEAFAQMEAAEQ